MHAVNGHRLVNHAQHQHPLCSSEMSVPNSGLPALSVQQETSTTGVSMHMRSMFTGYWRVDHTQHWHTVVQQRDERAKQWLACRRSSTPQIHTVVRGSYSMRQNAAGARLSTAV
jgi:hypothetical protein